MYKIKTYNQIASRGLDRFSRDSYEVASEILNPDAILLRSAKLHDEPLPDNLKAVARAGAGVNNVPVEKLTDRGVVVFNTPGANANAVKELVMSGLLLGSRGIIPGLAYAQSLSGLTDSQEMNRQLEAEKKRFAGSELYGKTLGVIGLGAIGSMVAEMALAMGMKVCGYDPALSVDAAWRLPSQVERKENVQSLLAHSDFITLHVPAIEATQDMINADTLSAVKSGAVLLNFARGSIVNTQAVVESLDNERGLRQYICDFPEPGLLQRDDVLAMPHIGASTLEAEENCAVMAVDQLRDFLENGNIRHSVNFPQIEMPRAEGFRITISNENVSGVLGHVLSVLAEYDVNVIDMLNKSRDKIAYNIIDVEQLPGEAVIASIKNVDYVINVRLLS